MYLEIDWKGFPPTSEQVQSMWNSVHFHVLENEMEQHSLIRAYREINSFEENVIFLQLKGPEDPIFSWYASRNRLPEINFFNRFLQSPAIASHTEDLTFDTSLQTEITFDLISGFCLGGSLAEDLFWGGTVNKYNGTAAKAKELGESFRDELINNRYDEVVVYRTRRAWSQWFDEYGADLTYIILDRRTGIFSFFCVTDSA